MKFIDFIEYWRSKFSNQNNNTINDDFANTISNSISNLGDGASEGDVITKIKGSTDNHIQKLNIFHKFWDSIKPFFGMQSIQKINTEIQNSENFDKVTAAIKKIELNPESETEKKLNNSINKAKNIIAEKQKSNGTDSKQKNVLVGSTSNIFRKFISLTSTVVQSSFKSQQNETNQQNVVDSKSNMSMDR